MIRSRGVMTIGPILLCHLVGVVEVRAVAPAEAEQVEVLEDDRQADRDHHLRDQTDTALAEAGEAPTVEGVAEQAAGGDGDRRGERRCASLPS